MRNIHSLLVTNTSGNILFSKYFDPAIGSKSLIFEELLFNSTHSIWSNPNSNLTSQYFTLSIMSGLYTVFKKTNELIIYITGEMMTDEVILGEVLDSLVELLGAISPSYTEASFFQGENFGKWSIMVDEMMGQGILEFIDPDIIQKTVKLKHF